MRSARDSIANLVLENKARRDRLVKVEDDLKWAIDEIENLETGGKGYTKEDEEGEMLED
jgi:hypothetical protein